MKCKGGVEIVKDGVVIQKQITDAMLIVDKVCATYGVEPVATSVLDGVHKPRSGRPSLHYKGMAFDLRVRDIIPQRRVAFRQAIATALGPGYDVVLEATPPHVHIEWDPQTSHLTMQAA